MIELSKILRGAFCCFVIIHMTYDLIMWKYQGEEERRVERGYAYTYSIIIILWTLTELITNII